MIKISLSCQGKEENKYILPFTEFYVSFYFPYIKEVDIECPENNEIKQPDYFLVQPKVLVEIKGIHDEKLSSSKDSERKNIDKLKKKLKTKNLDFIKGFYMIEVPYNFRVKQGHEGRIIEEIIKGITDKLSRIDIRGMGRFKISKVSDKGHKMNFVPKNFALWEGEIIKILDSNLRPKIKKANEQLGPYKDGKIDKKILLLVNQYIVTDDINDFKQAISYSRNELLGYKNIDEIWLQLQTRGKFSHSLLYTRCPTNSKNDL